MVKDKNREENIHKQNDSVLPEIAQFDNKANSIEQSSQEKSSIPTNNITSVSGMDVSSGLSTDTDIISLPLAYNSTTITLLSRSPNSIYAYWEVALSSLKQAANAMNINISNLPLKIRMYELEGVGFDTQDVVNHFDVDINKYYGGEHINVYSSGGRYYAEIGVGGQEDIFYSLAKSNIVVLPHAGVVGFDKELWMDVKESEHDGKIEKKAWVSKGLQQEGKTNSCLSPVEREPLSVEEIMAYYFRFFGRYRARRPVSSLRESEVHKEGYINVKDVFWAEKGISLLFTSSRMGDELSAISSDTHVANNLSISSKDIPAGNYDTTFFFDIFTEVIIYGRTEPGARVYLNGMPISVRPDGSFSLRYGLGDEHIPLQFSAVSSSGEKKIDISTSVFRSPLRRSYHG